MLQLGLGVAIGMVLVVPLSASALEGGSFGGALKVSAVMVSAGLLACAGPAWRVLQVEPTQAMRADG